MSPVRHKRVRERVKVKKLTAYAGQTFEEESDFPQTYQKKTQ